MENYSDPKMVVNTNGVDKELDYKLKDQGEEMAFNMAHFFRAYQQLSKADIILRARALVKSMNQLGEQLEILIAEYENI